MDSNQITSEVLTITPELAERWLGKNTENRSIRRARVEQYALDMASGNWKMTDESVKFSTDGRLIDGQHRLLAVVRSGATIQTRVTWGLEAEAQGYMDAGSARSASDALSFQGMTHATTIAAMARLDLSVRAGSPTGKPTISHANVLEWTEAHPEAEAAAVFASRYARNTDCKKAMVAYTYMVLAAIDADDAMAFWVSASEKTGLRNGDPVIAMTNRFAEARRNRETLRNDALLSLIYRAWNYRRQGKPWKLARVKSSGEGGGLIPIPEPM